MDLAIYTFELITSTHIDPIEYPCPDDPSLDTAGGATALKFDRNDPIVVGNEADDPGSVKLVKLSMDDLEATSSKIANARVVVETVLSDADVSIECCSIDLITPPALLSIAASNAT